MANEIEIDGIITVPDGVDADLVNDEFIEWAESKGYTFGGKISLVSSETTKPQS